MTDEATHQVKARLDFVAQENVLHEQLAKLNAELIRALSELARGPLGRVRPGASASESYRSASRR
jgi:hypothetical protein